MRPPIKNRRYPPGFRFVPTDAEVLKHLEMKIANPQYECPMITSIDVSQHTPEELVNLYRPKGEDICYFFTSRNRKYQKGTRPNRAAKGGFYKASGVDKPVMDKNGKIIGSRRSLVYQRGTHKKSTTTSWLMTEYLIDKYQRPIDKQSDSMMLDESVICKVYFNNQKRKKSQPEQGESSESQRGSEYEAAGHTEGENQMVVSTNCSKEVQGLCDMTNSVEQVMVENKMGKNVDKGKGPLIYCNDPPPLSWDIPADPSFPSTSLGSYDKCYDKNFCGGGQFNNNLDSWPNGGDMISQYTQVYGGPCFDGSENGGMYPNGYGCGYDEQLLNMVHSNDQHNSLNNDVGCTFVSQCAERDGNKVDNSLTSRSNGDNIGYDGQLVNMQFNDQLHSLNNDGGCSFDFQSATGDDNQLQFDNNLTSQSIGNNIGYDLQFADMQFVDQLTLNKDGGSIINFQSFIEDDNNLGYDYDPQLADILFDDLFNSMNEEGGCVVNEEGGCVQLQFSDP